MASEKAAARAARLAAGGLAAAAAAVLVVTAERCFLRLPAAAAVRGVCLGETDSQH